MGDALDAIERAVASVTDAADPDQLVAALRAVSPAMVDDVVFGSDASVSGAAADGTLLVVGTAASPGTGVGRVALSADEALDQWEAGQSVVLLVDATSPADERAMRVASAILTRRGGVASHAAIIARQWGVPAVCGVGEIAVSAGSQVVVDGSTGEVRALDPVTAVDALDPRSAERDLEVPGPLRQLPDALVSLLGWADHVASSRIAVLANADVGADAALARDLGAAGIGLCRTEHQFLGDRASVIARVLAGDSDALSEFVALQRADLVAVISAVAPLPVVIRLLDAPLHEFDPAQFEHNPMLGTRGVRVAVLYPEIVAGQAEALAHAIADVLGASEVAPEVSVLIPMVSVASEVELVRSIVGDALFRIGIERGVTLECPVGTMIETPRAALCASSLAPLSDFFSFGTNDLTQLTWGFSRDDLDETLVPAYVRQGLIARSPFETLDGIGVVRLMALAAETGRAARPGIGLSMCGEHGGDPASIAIALQLGLNSVSVSPFRVPAARLAAAHAVLGPPGRSSAGASDEADT